MSERKFAEGLQRRGNAARIRETVSQAMRENEKQLKQKLAEPIDYETFVVKNKVLLHNDPQRDMLNFPHDDVFVPPPQPKRKVRTAVPNVPNVAAEDVTNLLVKECLKTYTSQLQTVKFKYNAYAGSYQQLPNAAKKEPLQEHVFEIDAEVDEKDDDTMSMSRGFISMVTKRGWLLKGPDSGKDNIISFTRQFKRRHFVLMQQQDDSYVLEFFKDERKSGTKGQIFLDSASDVVKNTKKGKYCFEVRMTNGSPKLLAAENESEMNDWIITLNKVINSAETASTVSRDSMREENSSMGTPENYQESKMNHPVVKYCRETDSSLAKLRQESRQNPFAIYSEMRRNVFDEEGEDEEEDEIEVFPRLMAERYLLQFVELKFSLQVNMADEGKGNLKCNPEPFFVTFAVYDAKEGKKISEDFHVDPNNPEIMKMIPGDILSAPDRLNQVNGKEASTPDLNDLSVDWLMTSKKQGILSVSKYHQDIYLVARIEKVLQGALTQCVEPYLKGADTKMALKVHRQMKQFCSQIGHYRMPFAWAAKPLNASVHGKSEEMLLIKQDTSRFSDEELVKLLQDMRKPDKQGKLQHVPGMLKVYLRQLALHEDVETTVTPSLVPVKPFSKPTEESVLSLEVEEFVSERAPLCSSFDSYVNNLYVRPLALKYDSQKAFAKARNIACCIELRDSDDDTAVPLKRIYGRPGPSVFTTQASTTVVHHAQVPNFMEEVKVSLPVQLHEKHHLFFRFYHVSCEGSKAGSKTPSNKKKDSIEMPVGYTWLPLMVEGRAVTGDRQIPVAAHVPLAYLVHDTVSAGQSKLSSTDVKWIDGGKPLFKVNLHLVSTVYTQDQHLHNFFAHCQQLELGANAETNNVNKIKSLLAMEVGTYVKFLPTLLNQLFQLLSRLVSEDVAANSVRVLIHVVTEVSQAGKNESLEKYVKYVFRPDPIYKGNKTQRTVHEELAKHLTSILRPSNTDPLVVTRFLKHAWFFFDVLLKSMTLYLIDTDRIKMPRNERFVAECQYRIQNLIHAVTIHIIQKEKNYKNETKSANNSLATFVKTCFTLMDRGYVFKLVSKYIEHFNPGDSKTLNEFKFEFLRIVCSHEHFIPLSLPLMKRGMVKNFKEIKLEDLKHDYSLSEEFCKQHYLVGVLLFELKQALSEHRSVRRSAITVLRNQLAKHSFDDRYSSKSQQGRIAALYLPLIGILLESKNQLLQIASAPKKKMMSPPPPTPSMNGDVQLRSDVTKSTMSLSAKGTSSPVLAVTPELKKKDSAVFAMIAGSVAVPHNPNELTVAAASGNRGSNSSLASDSSGEKEIAKKGDKLAPKPPVPGSQPSSYVSHSEAFNVAEIKDLLLCLLYLLKHLPEDILLGWFNNSSENDIMDFFTVLELGLKHFQYQGRKKIFTLTKIGDSRASTMPSALGSQKAGRPISISSQRTPSQYGGEFFMEGSSHTPTGSDADTMIRALQEANISTEIGLVVLDTLSLFSSTFKKDLEARGGDNHIMQIVFQIYLSFLRSSQSETLQKHVFGAWRAFIKKFQNVLFKGSADMCGELCFEILRCCNSKLNSTRREACALLYLLMRSNFEFSNRKSFTRVDLQVIISVSKIVGVVVGLSTTRFQESLAIVNNYASSDKSIQKTPFPGEVRDLTKRIRTVLMATAQMKENENDPELLADLQYSLAKSYASTPILRKTWLEAMASLHIRRKNFSEAGQCYIHISALIAEYLKRKGTYPQGCSSFGCISPNIVMEEAGIKDDSGMQDVQYTEETLVEFLEKGAEYFEKAQRYEVLGDVYKLIIPVFERLRNFDKLERSYQYLSTAYGSVLDVMKSGKRLLGTYFLVTFYGQTFLEDEDTKEYIYKEPKVTSLAEIRDRLQRLFYEKFGRDNVQMINDSKKISPSDLDSKYAYIQVVYVTPYFDEKELSSRVTDFERNNNVRRFMYELPFTRTGKERGSIEEQHKRRFIVTTTHSFPYVKKRIEVKEGGRKEIVLTPIEVAIDEMQVKVNDLREAINSPVADMKRLQLKLQGGVSTQVNAGPLAYAEAFLNPEKISKYPPDKSDRLKAVFREFVTVCKDALDLNQQLINTEQKEYHESLKAGFMEIAERLSILFGEKIVPLDWINTQQQRQSMTFIGGSAGTSSA